MKIESSGRSISYGKRIDFHTHILPDMDDGSTSVEMSIQMIQESRRQGVVCIVMTPHFYPSRDNPKHFFEKRNTCMEQLKANCRQRVPLLLAGAEVHYFEGITAMQDLPRMRIEKSHGLLVEMPMCTWSSRMVSDIAELNRQREYTVILAHIERYLSYRNLFAIRQLAASGVLMQVNADAFSGFGSSRKALKMLDEGLLHVLGSDCHNMTSRSPNLADAYDFIEWKRGEAAVREIMNNSFKLLSGQQYSRESVTADKESLL